MFSEALKEATQSVHTELERKLIAVIRKVSSPQEYIRLLELMYGFYFPVQEKLLLYPKVQKFSSHDRGRKAENLLADIHYFQPGTANELPLCNELPEINSYASAIGVLYVLEGSTLGGRIIAGMLSKQLGISVEQGFSFFNAYGDETKMMWDHFKLLLDGAWNEEERTAIFNGATATFLSFKSWITKQEKSDAFF